MVVLLVGLSGCASETVGYSKAAVAAYSPAPQAVRPLDLYPLAARYVAEHPGTDFLVGSGDSMRTLYKDHTVIITGAMPISGLKPGMTVVFRDDDGHVVAHVLVRKAADGWISMGVSNPDCDKGRVCAKNYVAVVVKAFEPTGNPMQALAQERSIRPAGAFVASFP